MISGLCFPAFSGLMSVAWVQNQSEANLVSLMEVRLVLSCGFRDHGLGLGVGTDNCEFVIQ